MEAILRTQDELIGNNRYIEKKWCVSYVIDWEKGSECGNVGIHMRFEMEVED